MNYVLSVLESTGGSNALRTTAWSSYSSLEMALSACGMPSAGTFTMVSVPNHERVDLASTFTMSGTMEDCIGTMMGGDLGILMGVKSDGSAQVLTIVRVIPLGRTCTRFSCVCTTEKDPVSGLPLCKAYTY